MKNVFFFILFKHRIKKYFKKIWKTETNINNKSVRINNKKTKYNLTY
jgi:hypothetical protein